MHTLSEQQQTTLWYTIDNLMNIIEDKDSAFYSQSDEILLADKALKFLDKELTEEERQEFGF